MGRTRVAILSDVRLYREGVVLLIRPHDTLELAGSASDPIAALALLSSENPNVVVVDVGTAGCFEFTRAATEQFPNIAIVGFAIADLGDEICAAAEAGMAAFVPREAGADELVAAIHRAARHELLVSAHVADSLRRRLSAMAAERRAGSVGSDLTHREREIVELIGRGHSNKAIAAALHVEVATVKNHVHNVLGKLGLSRRSELLTPAARRKTNAS